MRYAELVFGKPEILSGLQTCNHTFWQFLPKKLSTKYRRREPGKGKALRFPAVFLLNTLLSFSLTPEEKEHILEKEYGISMEMKIRKELEAMCNLSEAIEERGVERGMRQGLERGLERGSFIAFSSLVRDGLLRTDEAARCMKMSEEDFVARMREERENEKTI